MQSSAADLMEDFLAAHDGAVAANDINLVNGSRLDGVDNLDEVKAAAAGAKNAAALLVGKLDICRGELAPVPLVKAAVAVADAEDLGGAVLEQAHGELADDGVDARADAAARHDGGADAVGKVDVLARAGVREGAQGGRGGVGVEGDVGQDDVGRAAERLAGSAAQQRGRVRRQGREVVGEVRDRDDLERRQGLGRCGRGVVAVGGRRALRGGGDPRRGGFGAGAPGGAEVEGGRGRHSGPRPRELAVRRDWAGAGVGVPGKCCGDEGGHVCGARERGAG